MAKDAEIDSKISSTTKSAKNLSALIDMAEDAQVGKDDSSDNETVKRLPLSKKPNVSTEYLIFLYFGKRWVFFYSFCYDCGSWLEALPEWLWAKFASLLA